MHMLLQQKSKWIVSAFNVTPSDYRSGNRSSPRRILCCQGRWQFELCCLSLFNKTLTTGNLRKTTFISSTFSLSTPAVPNCCCSKGSPPYWSNPLFLIFDIRALWRSVLSARAPECQKLKNGGLDQYGKVQSLNGISDERVKQLWKAQFLQCLSTHFLVNLHPFNNAVVKLLSSGPQNTDNPLKWRHS